METYTEPREMVENPHYQNQRQNGLRGLTDNMIDEPIVGLVSSLNKMPYCFTLQCCYGHFVYKGQSNPHNLEPLPIKEITGKIEYRIAYIAFCIENSFLGRQLFTSLHNITAIDPENIQLCCAEWFWKKQVNSYALQVEPDRFKKKDTALVGFKEALYIEKIRNDFFARLYELLENEMVK